MTQMSQRKKEVDGLLLAAVTFVLLESIALNPRFNVCLTHIKE